MPTRKGSIHLFRLAGIDVYLHWSWFLIAVYGISIRAGRYSSIVWPALEYVALFLIVLVHEFGHALACRSVGGRAERIVLSLRAGAIAAGHDVFVAAAPGSLS